jgi:hypothetical protein
VIACIQWFLQVSNSQAGLDTKPYAVNLLHVNKQSDGHSCGIFAQNSLDRYFNPHGHIQLVAVSMRRPRAERFIKISRRHLLSPTVHFSMLLTAPGIELTRYLNKSVISPSLPSYMAQTVKILESSGPKSTLWHSAPSAHTYLWVPCLQVSHARGS